MEIFYILNETFKNLFEIKLVMIEFKVIAGSK